MVTKEFSVSMCVYGGDNPEWFRTAIDSVLNQTLKPTEIILVVDGPVPEKLNFEIEKCELNPIFKIIRLKENQGHGNARRIGLVNCKHEIVALMDADDICKYNRFEEELQLLINQNADIVGGDIAEFIDVPENLVSYRKVPTGDFEIKNDMKRRCSFNQMTVMFKKNIYNEVGGYIDWFCNEDYYLWLRMLQAGARFVNTGTVLVYVRIGKEMYQRRGGWKYFRSEIRLQKYMLKSKTIGRPTYIVNCGKRFIVQVMLPNRVRGWVFKKFARKEVKV